ncbi:hypothetical protein PHYSODRAFT_441694, partial [Phytophthora sojae]
KIFRSAKNNTRSHIYNQIPICSGISGMGKTRMLEEGGMILRDYMGLDEQCITSVIVPFYDEFGPNPADKLMTTEASLAWRLLY